MFNNHIDIKRFFLENYLIIFSALITIIVFVYGDSNNFFRLGSSAALILSMVQNYLWLKINFFSRMKINFLMTLGLLFTVIIAFYPSGYGIQSLSIVIVLLIPLLFAIQILVWLSLAINFVREKM